MLIGQPIEDNSEINESAKMLAHLPEQEFKIRMNSSESSKEQPINEVLKLFHYLCFKEDDETREFLSKEGFNSQKIDLFLKQNRLFIHQGSESSLRGIQTFFLFELWKENEPMLKKVDISDRERLVDLQWKLVVKSGGSLPSADSIYVQLVLLVEKNNKAKKHHLQMGVQNFYDFLHKLNNGNDGIKELVKS